MTILACTASYQGIRVRKERSLSEVKIDLKRYERSFPCIILNYTLCIVDIPEFDPDDLHKFCKPLTVSVGQNAAFKMPFAPQEALIVNWSRNGIEVKDGGGVKVVREPNHSRLLFRDCLRADTGEIQIQLKSPFGTAEATSQLFVLGKTSHHLN